MKVLVLFNESGRVIGTCRQAGVSGDQFPRVRCEPMAKQTMREMDVSAEIFAIDDGDKFHQALEALLEIGRPER